MKIILMTLCFVGLSGCSAYSMWYGSDKPVMSYVFFKEDGTVTTEFTQQDRAELQGYIVTWSPEYNGAFVSNTGRGCVQPAIYAKTKSGEASLPTEVFAKLAGSSDITVSYAEALEKLVSVTDQATFLSIGMYGICQLSAADMLNSNQTSEVVKLLLEKAAGIKGTPTTATSTSTGGRISSSVSTNPTS